MSRTVCLFVVMCCLTTAFAQQPSTDTPPAAHTGVPGLMTFSSTLRDANGKPFTGVTGVTFLLYKDEQGGSPLWMETQNVQPDKSGHYSVTLGSTTSGGMPRDVFVSGEARWLGVQVAGEQEQPRTVLAAVPYSLKAADAETIGGLPASAFVLANGTNKSTTSAGAGTSPGTTPGKSAPAHAPVTGKGVVNFIPMWDKTSDIVDSLIFQKSSQIGINTKAPGATFDVNGKSDIRDTLTLFPQGTDSTLAISGTPFNIDNTGNVTFISGQTFPGTGTITGVTTASGSGLSGGGTTGTLNLSVDPNVVPELAAANTFTNTNAVNVNSGAPALTLQNASGDGLDIYPGTGSDGVYIPRNAGQYGIVAYGGSVEGGYFNGPVAGSYSVNTTDGNGSAAAYGQEFGSTQITYGVVGSSASNIGIGIYGQAASASVEGRTVPGFVTVGVWGDTGVFQGAGVTGTADDGYGVLAYNNSGTPTAFFENDETVDPGFPVLTTYGSGYNGACNIDVSGNLTCRGTKSAVVPVDGGARQVALYAVESPENWFEDFGSGQLSNGVVTIFLEPTFQQTVNTDADYHVFLTPNGDSHGLYVTQKTATSFEVREQGGGTSSVAFDYRIVARRKGYEQIRLADKTQLMNSSRPKRVEGPRSVMPTELGIGKAHEPGLRAARPAQLVVNKK